MDRLDELLEVTYRSADLGNLDDPLAETVFILLSQQTRENVYRPTFAHLRARYPKWLDVLSAPLPQLETILAPCGFHRRRAGQLRAMLQAVRVDNEARGVGPFRRPGGDLTLNYLAEMDDEEAERFLQSMPGIGPKTARCVLAYSLSRHAFAVDTHVHRIFCRLGIAHSKGRKADHDPFQEAVPRTMRKRLHINLIHHGRAICRSSRPKCEECVLLSFCAEGRATVANDHRAVAVDLFAGAGGLGRGFRTAGFRIALAVERDRHAAQTYRVNNPGVPVIEAAIDEGTTGRSLRGYVPQLETVHALLAGPPCQGYSAAGTRDPHADSNRLYVHVARLAGELNVDAVCLENVPGVRRVNGHGFVDRIVEEFATRGYGVTPHLLRACSFGVPQHRQRYFFLGTRCDRAPVTAPAATHRGKCSPLPEALPSTPALDQLLDELPTIWAGSVAEPVRNRDGVALYNVATMAHSPRVIRKISRIKQGEGPISYRRLEADEARTLIAGHRALPVHPAFNRTISVREAAVIQGFPLDYVFCGPRAEQPLQVANAVPPPMANAVAEHLLHTIGGNGLPG